MYEKLVLAYLGVFCLNVAKFAGAIGAVESRGPSIFDLEGAITATCATTGATVILTSEYTEALVAKLAIVFVLLL